MSIVSVSDKGRIRWIRLDRPGKVNALRDEDVEAVIHAVEHRPADTEVLVFEGGNGNFSAGVYIENFSGFDQESSLTHIRLMAKFLATVRSAPVPTIAAIEGYCIGLAFDLALVCDFRIAGESATFSMPEINVGMPCVMDISILQQHIGLTRAKEMLLTGGRYPARTLDQWGFLNRVVQTGEAHEAASALAASLLGKSPTAVASQMRLFEVWLQMPHREGVEVSLMEFSLNFADPRTQAWVSAYRAKMADANAKPSAR